MAAIPQNYCDVSCGNLLPFLYLEFKFSPVVLSPETEVRVCALLTCFRVRELKGFRDFVRSSNYNYCGKTCSQQAATVTQTNAAAYSQPQSTSTLCKVLAFLT